MLLVCRRLGVPMIVGSAGDIGSNSRVDLFVDIIRDLAEKHRPARFRVGGAAPAPGSGRGDAGLDGRPPLDLATLEATDPHRPMAGIHPYVRLLDAGADVIIGGRSSDE